MSTEVEYWSTRAFPHTIGSYSSTRSTVPWGHVLECHVCESKIPEDRKGQHVTCSPECERAAQVAARLAGPERGDLSWASLQGALSSMSTTMALSGTRILSTPYLASTSQWYILTSDTNTAATIIRPK